MPGSLAASWSWVGAAVGAGVAVGALLVVAGLPMNRQPTLMDRLEPYLRDAPRPSRLLARRRDAANPLQALFQPLVVSLGRWVERILGGSASVRRRQERSGLVPDVDGFRAQQVVWGALAGVVGVALAALLWLRRGGDSVVPSVLIIVLSVACGVVACDQRLSYAANRREQRMMAEFPTIAELLALAVSAGEGAVGALERVCRHAHGELSGELRTCLADARAGANLPAALQGLAARTGLPALSRFVDGIVVAVERGTPLAQVLRAQAQDVREAGRRAVMEAGGRKEIAMMIPVVFLVLPVTVLFAVYPGFAFLRFDL